MLQPMEAARRVLNEASVNLFLTGRAGTGKTTFLRQLVAECPKRMVVLAPTGVAAINAGGSTIHSFFQLDFAPFLPDRPTPADKKSHRFAKSKINLIRTLDLLVIDEVSMVRPDVLDAVDATLRRLRSSVRPFGGVQLLLIGDLRQLPPVVKDDEWRLLSTCYASPYFFESRALKESGFLMVELTHIYRQTDPTFVEILNRIRDNSADAATLAALNRRAAPGLMPADGDDDGYIRLTTHNYRADAINGSRLAALRGVPHIYRAKVSGKFPESSYPAEETLTLKPGAQVMFIKNDASPEKAYYNGLIGEVVAMTDDNVTVRPRRDAETGRKQADITVEYASWDNTRYELGDDGEVKEEIEGSFSQIPLRPAWAITIHKSQGLTFDRAIIDAARSFAPGQCYVALSRCRSLEGLVLDSPLPLTAIMTDSAVNAFISEQPRLVAGNEQIERFADSYYCEMLLELFTFRKLDSLFDGYYRAAAAALPRKFPAFMSELDEMRGAMGEVSLTAGRRAAVAEHPSMRELTDVAARLHAYLLRALPHRSDASVAEAIDGKVRGGARWFSERLRRMRSVIEETPMAIENKVLLKRLTQHRDELLEMMGLQEALLRHFGDAPFGAQEYLRVKTRHLLATQSPPRRRRRAAR